MGDEEISICRQPTKVPIKEKVDSAQNGNLSIRVHYRAEEIAAEEYKQTSRVNGSKGSKRQRKLKERELEVRSCTRKRLDFFDSRTLLTSKESCTRVRYDLSGLTSSFSYQFSSLSSSYSSSPSSRQLQLWSFFLEYPLQYLV